MLNKDGTINPERNIEEVKKGQRWKRNSFVVFIMLILLGTAFVATTVTLLNRITNSGLQTQVSVRESAPGTKNQKDDAGNFLLTDKESGAELTVRSEGDSFYSQARIDPKSGRKLDCLSIEATANLFHDTVSRTEASVVIVDEDGLEKQVVPINGQFVDNESTLRFGRGEDSITVIMDSDACNTAVLPADVEDTQVDPFKRALQEPPMSKIDALAQNRDDFERAKSPNLDRNLGVTKYVEIVSELGLQAYEDGLHCEVAPCTGTSACNGNTATIKSCGSCKSNYACQNNSGEVGENSCTGLTATTGKYSCAGNTGAVGADSW